jgi:cytochrome P450
MTAPVNLTDLDLWARGVPYGEFARLRRDAPVAWFPDEGSGFWGVHRYADIVTASRDVRTFSSARGVSFEEPTDEDMAARRTIIDTDPPEHTKLRKIVSGAFSLRAVAVYEHFIAGLTEPGDDLLSRLVGAEVDGERLTETDLDNFFSILVVAGNETTRIAIAQGVLAFCQYPDQWDRLRADPGLLETATDEVIRWSCPTHFMRRTAAADTELGGAAIRAGDKVVLWYVSGNRDEAEFERPDAFDVGRSPNRHLSFGRGGPHLCLGVHLARLEVKVALAALARRVRRFELAGPPRRIRSNFTNGLRELPVRAYQ